MTRQDLLEQVRDILFQTLCVKRGQLITKALAWDRANNGVQAIQDFLCEPPKAKSHPGFGETGETMEEMAERIIK